MFQIYEPYDAGKLRKSNQMVYEIRETIPRRMCQRASYYGTRMYKVDRGSVVNHRLTKNDERIVIYLNLNS